MEEKPILRSSTKSNKTRIFQLVVGFILLALVTAGFVYTNLQIQDLSKHNEKQASDISQLEETTEELKEISTKGGTEELLGFDQVDKDGYQSVFLKSDKVYFGKITSMSTENITLEDVFYLRTNDTSNNANDSSLVKLGCELHRPEDKMTIIRANVEFWENMKNDGTSSVAGAIIDYKNAYPNGQECAS